MLLTPEPIAVARKIVTSQDFYKPSHGALFDTIIGMHGRGEAVDPVTVATRLNDDEIGRDLVSMMVAVPSTHHTATYAQIVADHATARLLIAASSEITELGYTSSDVGDAVDRARSLVDSVRAGLTTANSLRVESLDDVVNEPEVPEDWVIPQLLTRSDRVVLVAGEGVGKTMLWRQIAILCGQGIHPFRLTAIPPVRTMLVDLENPRNIIRRTCDDIIRKAVDNLGAEYQPGKAMIVHEPGGIDIRTRVGFGALDEAFRVGRPDLVCLGPLYKLYRQKAGESMEDAAIDVTGRLDDLRTRHSFALFLEHHAPKGSYGMREMTPFGSSIWQRWPEFGPALTEREPKNRNSLIWSDWRPPREVRPWPVALDRGQIWPWDATHAEAERRAA